MKFRLIFLPLALLLAAGLACSPASLAPSSLFKDNFSKSDSGWCVDKDNTSALDYIDGEYVFTVQSTNWFVWCNPGQTFDDIHVETTAKNVSGSDDTIFGLVCHYQQSDDFYYLGITSQGLYTIRLYLNGKDQVLAEDQSASITPNADSYLLGADCGNGSFTLYVDGQQIATASDDTYTSGDIGLFTWSGENVPAEIHYDDIAVTRLASGN